MPIVNCQMSPARSRGSVSLGAWFGFAFLAAVLCELCGKEELNREERQGFAKDAKQVLIPRGKLRHCRKRSLHCARSRTRRMIVAMIDANHISERLASLRLEMSDLRVANARYWSRKEHTALDKQASALRQQRLIEIKLELADMSKRCA